MKTKDKIIVFIMGLLSAAIIDNYGEDILDIILSAYLSNNTQSKTITIYESYQPIE